MGSSNTIEQQAALNTKFQQYIDDQNKVLDAATKAARSDMDKAIDNFAKQGGWTDLKPFASGSYQHLATASTWSLDRVSDMLNSIASALMGGKSAPPAKDPNSKVPTIGTGTTVQPADPATKALLASMGGTELIIAAAALDVVQSILSSFSSSTQTDIVKDVRQKDLLPGLSLFITVMENQYRRNDFFGNEMIIENFYIYDVRMSAQRAADIAKMNRLNGLIYQQQVQIDAASNVSAQIPKLDPARPDYLEAFQKLTAIVDGINKSIDKIAEQIKALRAANMLAAAHAANAALMAYHKR